MKPSLLLEQISLVVAALCVGLAPNALPWKLGFVFDVVVWVVRGVLLLYVSQQLFFSWAYGAMMRRNKLNVDKYTKSEPGLRDRAFVAFTHWSTAGLEALSDSPRPPPIPLEAIPSPYVDKLRVNYDSASLAEASKSTSPRGGGPGGAAPRLAIRPTGEGTLFVGTIRMGFGHHRIAYAASSWGLDAGMGTYFHDLLNISSRESKIIKNADGWYSWGSRLASELGGFVEKIWGALTLSGDENSLRTSWQMAEELKPLMMDLDKNVPVITSHSLVGMVAVACGFKHVINLVIDNFAQWFVVVPGAINLVQGPANYEALLRMGIPPEKVRLAGHWVPKGVHASIEPDCRARIARARSRKSPRRLIVPVGGAGAQRKFVSGFVQNLLEPLKDGKVRLFLNAGDHVHMHKSLKQCLVDMGIEFKVISSFEDLEQLVAKLKDGQKRGEKLQGGDVEEEPDERFVEAVVAAEEGLPLVIMFAFDDYFPAVATTDMLMPVADILCCKPSELAFYPIPKLMIRRVGDHEAHSATRAAARDYVDRLCSVEKPDLFISMNKQILKNLSIGIYDGCKNAVKLAAELAKLD